MAITRVTIQDNRLLINLANMPEEMREAIYKETGIQSEKLTTYIIERHLTGGTKRTRLKVRSGQLRRTTRPISTMIGEKMKGGTKFGVLYAGAHMGPKGSSREIKPRKTKYLAIPIGAALTSAGVAKYRSPHDVGGLVPIKSKKGNIILAKVDGGAITPYFVLKKKVKLKARIHPDEILAARMPSILRGYEEVIEDTLRENL